MSSYRQRLAAVRASYSPAKAQEERQSERLAYWIYRPLSFYVTPLFLALGWTADGVSVLQLALALAMPFVALAGGVAGAVAVAAIGLAIQVLDCVDGNVARVTRYSSAAGQMMDGLCTLAFWALYFVAIGVLVRAGGVGWWGRHGLEIGLAVSALFLGQREFEDTFASCFDQRVRWTPPAVQASRFTWLPKVLEQTLAFGALVACALAGRTAWFLAALASYQAGLFVVWLPRFGRALRERMRERTGGAG